MSAHRSLKSPTHSKKIRNMSNERKLRLGLQAEHNQMAQEALRKQGPGVSRVANTNIR